MCIREEVFGWVSAECGDSLHAFGAYHVKQESLVAALRYFRKALRVREQACGFAHPSTASTCAALAEVLMGLKQVDEAGIYMMRATKVREGLFGADDELAKELHEKWNHAVSTAMKYDPVE